jgi:hypothetical protein
MGCLPEEVPVFEKTFPGSTYDDTGRLLIRNRKHKMMELKRRGYRENN